MALTAAELAFDIITRNKDKVQACKYTPRGPQADAVTRFMNRAAGHEVFITQAQASLFDTLLNGASVITNGSGDGRFGAFVKTIWSEGKQQNYYLLVFCGYVPTATPAHLAPKVEAVQKDASDFAAKLITSAIGKGFAKPDERATDGGDYLTTWLSKAQADALVAQLPQGAVKADGGFLTQACGTFCFWGKVRTATGAMLLCWMGEVSGTSAPAATPVVVPPVKPVAVTPPGKLIPLDMDIPF